ATFRALNELVSTGILVPAGDGYRSSHRGLAELVASQVDATRRRTLHGRLAKLKEGQGDPFGLAHHLLEAGESRRAVDVVRAHGRARVFAQRPGSSALLERVLGEARALGLPHSEILS